MRPQHPGTALGSRDSSQLTGAITLPLAIGAVNAHCKLIIPERNHPSPSCEITVFSAVPMCNRTLSRRFNRRRVHRFIRSTVCGRLLQVAMENADVVLPNELPCAGPAGTICVVHYDLLHRAMASRIDATRCGPPCTRDIRHSFDAADWCPVSAPWAAAAGTCSSSSYAGCPSQPRLPGTAPPPLLPLVPRLQQLHRTYALKI